MRTAGIVANDHTFGEDRALSNGKRLDSDGLDRLSPFNGRARPIARRCRAEHPRRERPLHMAHPSSVKPIRGARRMSVQQVWQGRVRTVLVLLAIAVARNAAAL